MISTTTALLASAATFIQPVAEPPAPHYGIGLTLAPEQGELAANLWVKLDRERVGDGYQLVLAPTMEISEISAMGAEVSVGPPEGPLPPMLQAIKVTPQPGDGPIYVSLRYSGALFSMQPPGMPINSITPELIELSIDSFWLPFPQEFNVGLTADMTVSGIDPDAAVASTGTVSRRGDIVTIDLDVANDLALTASPLFQTVADGDITYVATDPEGKKIAAMREHGTRILEFYEQLLGPSALDGFSVVLVNRESGVGYNRPGYIVIGGEDETDNPLGEGLTLAHEIAHNWWFRANFLTEDYWLVEGPAEYYMLRYGDSAATAEQMEPFMANQRRRAAAAGKTLDGSGNRIGGSETYQKPALLLRMLEQRIGREPFDALMREMAAMASPTTADFFDRLRAHGNDEAAEWFEAALRAEGMPD